MYVQVKKVLKEQFKAFKESVKNELDSKGIRNQFEQEDKKESKKWRRHDRER